MSVSRAENNRLRKLWSTFSTLNDVKRKRQMMTLDANVLASSCCGTRHQRSYAAVAACNVFTPHHMDLVAISCLTGFTHGAEKDDEFKSVCPWDQSGGGWTQFGLSRLKSECIQAAAHAGKDKTFIWCPCSRYPVRTEEKKGVVQVWWHGEEGGDR